MNRLSPSQVYIAGTAGAAASTGFYYAAYAVFLWTYLSGEPHKLTLAFVALLLGFKFLFEFVFEVASSVLGDLSSVFSRRAVFLSGFLFQLLGYLVLALFQTWSAMPYAVAGILLAEVFRSAGNAAISGTFDGWAVSLERSRAAEGGRGEFSAADMFTGAQLAQRAFLFFGALIATGLLIAQYFLGHAKQFRYADWTWVFLWAVAALIQLLAFIVLLRATRGFDDVRVLVRRSGRPSLAAALRAAFNPASLPAWILLACIYTLTLLTTYAWPMLTKVLEIPGPWEYSVPLALLGAGIFGSLRARRYSAHLRDSGSEAFAVRYSMAIAVLLGLTGVVVYLYASISQSWFRLPLVAILAAMGLGSRYAYSIATPFVSTLVHLNTGDDERLRASVVSIRSAGPNLVLSAAYFWVFSSSQIIGQDREALGRSVGLTLALVSLVVVIAVESLRRLAVRAGGPQAVA